MTVDEVRDGISLSNQKERENRFDSTERMRVKTSAPEWEEKERIRGKGNEGPIKMRATRRRRGRGKEEDTQ